MPYTNVFEFYRSKEWRNVMHTLKLERVNENGDLICEHCGEPIIKSYDCIGHHKIELNNVNVHDPEIALNPDNIMLIHFKCHNEIHERFGYERPQQVYIVYGSPCSGKSTWVKNNAAKDDLVLDIDNIYEMINPINSKYEKSKKLSQNVFCIRDCILDMIKTRTGKWQNAYIIGGYPLAMERKRLADLLGAKLCHIETDKETCIQNLYNDKEREQVKDQWLTYIEDYWSKYQPDDLVF